MDRPDGYPHSRSSSPKASRPGFRNFRREGGEPPQPYPIHFHTRLGAETSRGEANREAVEVLRDAIDHDYSYRDLRAVDWDAAFRAASSRLLEAPTAEAFAREA